MVMARAHKDGVVLDPTKHGAKVEAIQAHLNQYLIGQGEAITSVISALDIESAGLNIRDKTIGNLLFLGPTGTGKTKIVELLAQEMYGSEKALIKIDCGEFQHGHEIAKLVGSPPGYLGHRETAPMLTQEKLAAHFNDKYKISLVLFDEIEKAHDSLRRLMLGILDKAQITTGDNKVVDFSRAMVFMTSNLGAGEMASMAEGGLGFASTSGTPEWSRVKEVGLRAMRKKFSPEFINRIDKVVVFKSLGREQLNEILELELDALQKRLFLAAPVGLAVTPEAREWLLEKGVDSRYGARFLKRTLDRELTQSLAGIIASKQINSIPTMVHVKVDNGKLIFIGKRADVKAEGN